MTTTEILAVLLISDTIKPESLAAITDLHKMQIKVTMLSGDHQNTAQYIADQVKIDNVIAEVLPEQKASVIKSLQTDNTIIAMAGDGINDAPALAQADVGIAMGNGTDVAIESAQIILLEGNLTKLVKAMHLSKATMRTVKQNLFWAFIYNLLGIPLATGLFISFGVSLNPTFAGLAMAVSSVSVVLNSLRLKYTKI